MLRIVDSDAERDRHRTIEAVERRVRDDMPDALRGFESAAVVRLGHDDDELLAAETREGIRIADRASHRRRLADEDGVAARMTKRVVDPLEVIDVDREHGPRPLVASCA